MSKDRVKAGDRMSEMLQSAIGSTKDNTSTSYASIVDVIPKKPKEKLKHVSYYLNPKTVKDINKYHKDFNMSKSELVDTILSLYFDNIEK